MNIRECLEVIAKWGGTLRYFPADPHARLGIAEEIGSMTSDLERVRWLVTRVPKLYADWPGMREVRAVFCSRFRPLDGVDAYSELKRYAEGFPSERPPDQLQLAGKRDDAETLTGAESIRPVLKALAEAKAMGGKQAVVVPEIQITRGGK